jgi:hypothetical protein
MFIERKIEEVIRDQVRTDLDAAAIQNREGFTIAVDYRTMFAEPAYTTESDVSGSYPMVYIEAAPSDRVEGQMDHRQVALFITMLTKANSDFNRSVLREMYSVVRNTLETTTWDFGSEINYTNNSYSIGNGSFEASEDVFMIQFGFNLEVCGPNFQWTE